MIIFGQPPDSPGLPLRISLARIIPDRVAVEQAKPRVPRPDDPLPRFHPIANLINGQRRPKRPREGDTPSQKKRKVSTVGEESTEMFRLPALPPPRPLPSRLNGVVEKYSKQPTDTPTQKQSSRNQGVDKDQVDAEDSNNNLLVDNESALVASNKMVSVRFWLAAAADRILTDFLYRSLRRRRSWYWPIVGFQRTILIFEKPGMPRPEEFALLW